ncbi:uncharacterized protein [Montipora foliosa]|uniref:uncharacterized protein n=1 Tax=Montipora foliosa TaxID=591990 RepID=UPI0035F137E4
MGSLRGTSVLWLGLLSICWIVKSSQEMKGVFHNVGNKKTERFPVYKTVQGFDIFLRFSASQCIGELAEVTSRDTKDFLRIKLLEVGPIRFSFNTLRGRGQLDFAMPNKGSFCDGKRHVLALSILRGVLFYYVDRSPLARFYVSRLAVPFSSADKIVLGRGLKGCVSRWTVNNRFNKTKEHRIASSGECVVKKTTVRPTTTALTTSQPEITSIVMARKIAVSKEDSGKPNCEPLPLEDCKSLGYSYSKFPNLLKHKTSSKASKELSVLLSKLKPDCSSHLIPFLCHLYFPPCPLPKAPAPPCRSLCKSVMNDCSLSSLKDTWSSYVTCEYFPRASDKVKCFLGSTKATARRTTLKKGPTVKNKNLTDTNSLIALKGFQTKIVRSPKPLFPITTSFNAVQTEHQTNSLTETQGYSKKPKSLTETVFRSTAPSKTRMNEQVTNATTHTPTKKPVLHTTNSTKTRMYQQLTKPERHSNVPDVTGMNEALSNETNSLNMDYSTKQALFTKPLPPTRHSINTKMNKQSRNATVLLKQTKADKAEHDPSSKLMDFPKALTKGTRMSEKPQNQTLNGNATMTSFHPSNVTTYPMSSSGTGSCGGVLGSPEGHLTSPGYPEEYPSNTRCRWVISLSNDYNLIRITIQRMYLEEDRNSVYDYIAIYDILDNQVGERYCGSMTSPIHKDVKGIVAVVVFRSDSTNSKKGFSLSYEASKSISSLDIDT